MWRPLVLLLLLLLPVNPVPTAAAAPILDAKVQDNLQSLGCNRLLLEVGVGEGGGGGQTEGWGQTAREEGRGAPRKGKTRQVRGGGRRDRERETQQDRRGLE